MFSWGHDKKLLHALGASVARQTSKHMHGGERAIGNRCNTRGSMVHYPPWDLFGPITLGAYNMEMGHDRVDD